MANFNSSFWYHLYVNTDKTRSLACSNLYANNGTTGAVLYNGVAKQNATQRWQWYGVNSTTYVLRCEEAGPDAFLGTKFGKHENTPGQTQGLMVRNNISDDSAYWTVSPWGDGTFFLTNGANGTDWHLEKRGSGSIAMSSNITEPRNGQRWSFEAIEEIGDAKYSTIELPSQSTSTPPTNSDSSKPSTSDPVSASSGLSTGAKAGIGAGVGCIALIALIGLVLFLLRRRKQKNAASPYIAEQKENLQAPLTSEVEGSGKYEMGNEEARHEIAHGDTVKYGHHGVTTELEGDARRPDVVYEMAGVEAGEQRIAELPSTTVPR